MGQVVPFSASSQASHFLAEAAKHRALAKAASTPTLSHRHMVIAEALEALAETEAWLAGGERAQDAQPSGLLPNVPSQQ